MRVEFIKSYRDNPKVNAIILTKGRLRDWPQLLPLPNHDEPDEIEDSDPDDSMEDSKPSRKPSGPKTRDPYENEESPAMLPIFVAIGAFIPLVFCMCKL